jgi:putative FmdB family regulatory protein
MPVYEYFCRKCRSHFSAYLSIKEHDARPIACPQCGRLEDVEKQLSDVTVVTSRKA